jgi:hypothetical protein
MYAGNCYIIWHPTTQRVYTTRDVIWLGLDDDDNLLHIVASEKVDNAVEGESAADAVKATAGLQAVTFADEQGEVRRSTRTIYYLKDRYEAGTSGMEPYITRDDDPKEKSGEELEDKAEEDYDETKMLAWLSGGVKVELTHDEENFFAGMRSLN